MVELRGGDANQIFWPQTGFQIVGGGGANRPLNGVIAGLFFGIHHHRLLKTIAILKPFFELQKNV